MSITLSVMGESHTVELRARKPTLVCAIDDREVALAEAPGESGECRSIVIDGLHHKVWRALDGDDVWVHIGGRVFVVEVANPLADSNARSEAGNVICADMPGVIVELHTAPGAAVALGDAAVTIESMKMQIVLHAPRAGVIEAIHYQHNTAFDKGAVLISLKPPAD